LNLNSVQSIGGKADLPLPWEYYKTVLSGWGEVGINLAERGLQVLIGRFAQGTIKENSP
jgi:hypothetical protein